MVTVMFVVCGCSNGVPASMPDADGQEADSQRAASHSSWGVWQFTADPVNHTLDAVQLRAPNMHVNVLVFLEPPPLLNLTLESLEFNGNIIDADIGLRHPFLGLDEFTGFDVCGILISNGSIAGFSDPDLRMAGHGDTRLLNPDGYARWWNPAEFPVNEGTMFSYNDGLLGTPDSHADYNSTINAYKYYCDDLANPDDPLSVVNIDNRGMFEAGQKNVRHYTIELGAEGMIFNYAVDACWAFPKGSPPWAVPDDFPPVANRPEAWRVDVTEVANTLWNDGSESGGGLTLSLDVYDWYEGDSNTITVESPGNFSAKTTSSPTGSGTGYYTYEFGIIGATPAQTSIDLLISVESNDTGYGGLLPGVTVTAYFTHTSDVASSQPGYTWELGDEITLATHSLRDLEYPALLERPGGTIFAGWGGYMPNQSFGYCTESTDGGDNWSTVVQGTNNSGGYITDIKAAQDSTGVGYMGYQCSLTLGNSYAGTIGRFPPDGSGQDSGTGLVKGDNSCEYIFDSNGLVLFFGDYGNIINRMKGSDPNCLYYNGSWHWGFADPPAPEVQVAPSPSYCSKTRSIAMDSTDDIHMAYFGNSSTDWIRLASSSDDGDTWNVSDIYAGGTGIQFSRDPGMDIDEDDCFRVAFVRRTTAGLYELAYIHSSDGSAWSSPVTAYSSSDEITETTIDAFQQYSAQHVVISFSEEDVVYFVHSFDGGATWETPSQVSTGGETTKQPDMIVDSQNKVHFVYSVLVSGKYDIKYRNGVLVED